MHARWDRLTALLLLAFAGYTIAASRQMGYWQGRIPGPGFAPMWIGAGLALAALMLLVRPAPVGAGPPPADQPSAAAPQSAAAGREAVRVLQIAAVTVVATALIPRLGMLTAVALLLVVLVKLQGGSWRAAASSAVVLPVLFHVVFARWLQVPLPTGPWGF